MEVLTSLGTELAGKLLRRDLDVVPMLVGTTVTIVSIVDHVKILVVLRLNY